MIGSFTQHDIFVSYHHGDGEAYAIRMATLLRLHGLNVFIDASGTPPGTELKPAIAGALEQSRAVVCVVTVGALTSRWVGTELTTAFSMGKVVVPLIAPGIHGHSELPYPFDELKKLAWLNISDDDVRTGEPAQATLAGILSMVGAYRTKFSTYGRAAALLAVHGCILAVLWFWSNYRIAQAIEAYEESERRSSAEASARLDGMRRAMRAGCPDAIEVKRDVVTAECSATLFENALRMLHTQDRIGALGQIAMLATRSGDALLSVGDSAGALRAYERAAALFSVAPGAEHHLTAVRLEIDRLRHLKLPANGRLVAEPVLELLEAEQTRERNGRVRVRGRVKNVSSTSVVPLTVMAAWYTQSGEFLHAAEGDVGGRLDPGESGTFDFTTYGEVFGSRFRLSFRRFLGRELPFRHATDLRITREYLYFGQTRWPREPTQ